MILLLTWLLLPPAALADCHWNADGTFFSCETLGLYHSVSRTLPMAGDGLRFNPGSLPTVSAPIGLEATLSSKSQTDDKFQLSLIKGFNRIGFGIVSWAEDSFSTPNFQRYLSQTYSAQFGQYQESQSIGMRAGSALRLPLGKMLERWFRLNVGASFGQGKVSGASASSLGITADAGALSLGVAWSKEKISPLLPAAGITTVSGGLQSGGFYAGYSKMIYTIGGLNQPSVYFYSLRFAAKQWALHGAMKKDLDMDGVSRRFPFATIQRHLSRNFVLGYLYGLYPKAHSLSAQLYF